MDYFTLSKLVSKETEFKRIDVIKKGGFAEGFAIRVCKKSL